jgi:tetratricopeptide (TPR) repeat protein
VSNYNEFEFERLYTRLFHQKANAFFCVMANSIPVQIEIAEKISGRFPAGEVQIIDFRNINSDFRFSRAALCGMINEGARILFFTNFQLACGDLSDEDFCQVLNLSRDGLAELPYIFVFVMPLYFRKVIARNAPDFNSFFQYHVNFTTAEDLSQPLKATNVKSERYSNANRELLEYYREKYNSLTDFESEQAFENILKILNLNIHLRVLHFAELNRFIAEFKRLLQKYESVSDDSASDIAGVFESQGSYGKALEWYKKALTIREKALGKEHPDTAAACHDIADVYDSQGNYEKALELYEKALTIHEKVLGKEHPDTAATYNNIGIVYNNQGNYEKALEWYEKALTIREKTLGKEHSEVADTYHNIAAAYDHQENYDKALELYKKALAIREKTLGMDHHDTADSYNDIAGVYDSQGNYGTALEFYAKALTIREKAVGKEHRNTSATKNNITFVHDSQGNYDRVLAWYEKALAIRERMLDKDHLDTAAMYNNIAFVHDSQGNYEKALEWYEKALVIKEKVLGEDHPSTVATYNSIASVRSNQGKA